MEPIVLNGYHTLIAATLVLLLGRLLVKKIKFLQDFNIPEAVAGGLIAAAIIFCLYHWAGISFQFEKSLQNAFMLVFFSSIGLSADFSRLKQGGIPLVIFLIVVSTLIFIQNAVGVSLASMFGLDPKIGLITGSITLTGGHGTGAAWAETFTKQYGLPGVMEMAMASATFGLVAGGLIGGPVARRLVNNMKRGKKAYTKKIDTSADQYDGETFEEKDHIRFITASSTIETMALFAACLAFSSVMAANFSDLGLPQFVWALGFGVLLRNVLTKVFKFDMFDRAIDVFGNASLSLFLAMALMSIKLWELSGLAGPMLIILLVQTLVMILYGYFITFRVMGKDYDAAILTAGHCGFGLGATPTAVANMQSVTETFGPSHKAFLIVPLVGAFFVDLINLGVITWFIKFLG
ncbi:sodium/glutamate symporter [Actinobacillus minor]|uniref:Sodium/glutamate symporter n=1 Tax=Actinobacillus minor NM305 TaxID=637911 RepID=C5S2H9_9PAST|nr:sodium/glutamate symporter [Actinobacillus minor]EER46947.1 sodium/glutamate symport carrier protein [Actinobacillus minor NM305]MDD6910161.1 sodium/glutamate symporter [Actinobacillus minor]MDY4712466.1 sodium/glutamate symporter [Actinobacillus minor]MDY5107516.1 sodium/glutamate symporter [Actinobacillus minor]